MRYLLLLVSLLLWPHSAGAQAPVTPQQAIQAVQNYWGDPTIPATVQDFTDFGDTRELGIYYTLQVASGPYTGSYYVRASDGTIISFLLVDSATGFNPGDSFVLTLQQAQAAATAFFQQRYGPFAQGQWNLTYSGQADMYYTLEWRQVVDPNSGALGPYALAVNVNGYTGRIAEFRRPPDRPITGPTTPQVSLAQAQQIAAQYALFDPTAVPFTSITLDVFEDSLGIQSLEWLLWQYPYPQDPGNHCEVIVDAITGAVAQGGGPMGGSNPNSPLSNKKRRPTIHVSRLVTLRPAHGDVISSSARPRIENSHVWIRAELLRGLGAKVQGLPREVAITMAGHSVSGKEVGAKYHDYGWWVPLKKTVEKAGWKVEWQAAQKTVVVDNQTSASSVPSLAPVQATH